jgi:hypothetical protein
MNNRLSRDSTAADADAYADDEKVAAAAVAQVVRRLIVLLLLTAAALDVTRCGLVMTAARHRAPAAGLVATGLAAAALTARTARGCQVGQRWAGWTALLIGGASTPQAAASGFSSPYTIPDTATAALGLLLAITILATSGRMDRRDTTPKIPACWTREPRGDPACGRTFPSPADTALVSKPDSVGSSPPAHHDRPLSRPATGRHIADFVLHHLMSAQPTHAEEGAHPRERRMPPLHPPLPIRRFPGPLGQGGPTCGRSGLKEADARDI